ncbi:hypothetical protein J4422_03995 [Candidatus Pacearchaeota archaeon]|nr:hypothetical protein [Candidatus Pacearchaeota archaeon]
MRKLGIVISGRLEEVGMEYFSIVDKIRLHGISYPDYLTDEEIELANGSVKYFDRLAEEIEAQKKRVA